MRKRMGGPDTSMYEINMTPMIDCVFLLLTFFLFATKFPMPEGKLEASLPAKRAQAPPTKKNPPPIVGIQITGDGQILVNGQAYTASDLTVLLAKLSSLDPEQPVIISAAGDARHQWVVDALNACARANITRISFTGL